jgi:thiol-disulfide isomerase/thioredoxin
MAFICIQISQLYAQKKTTPFDDSVETYITCRIKNHVKSDTISLALNGPFFDYRIETLSSRFATQMLKSVANESGEYKFIIKTANSPFHVSLFLSNEKIDDYLIGKGDISGFLIMPGSNINIEVNGEQKKFTGKGALVLEVQDKIENTDQDAKILDDVELRSKDTPRWLKEKDSLLNVQLDLLASYKAKLPSLAYSIVHADVIGLNRGSVYMWMSYAQPFFAKRIDLTKQLAAAYDQLEGHPPYIDLKDNSCLSPKYTYYLYEKIKLEVKHDRVLAKLPPKMDQNYFPRIKTDYTGIVRDKLLARWIMDVAAVNNLQQEYALDVLALMHTPFFIDMVKKFNSAYQKGEPMTDFEFLDSNSRPIHLADFKGRIVVVDMWFTGCADCLLVAKGMINIENQYKDRNDIAFVTISVDRNKDTWLKSVNKNGGKYYITPNTTYLYTIGTGEKNPFIQRYVPDGGFPQLLIIGKNGKMFSATLPHPVNETLESEFVKQVNEALKQP